MLAAPSRAEQDNLRSQIIDAKKSISPADIVHESDIIEAKVLTSEWFAASNRCSIYVSTNTEVITDGIIKAALSFGKTVYIPHIEPDCSEMLMLKLDDVTDFELLKVYHKIRQYESSENHEEALENGPLDLLIMPGLAFTADGHRLGRRQCYYDNFLRNHQQRFGKLPKTIGLALSIQIMEKVPTDPGEFILDGVVNAMFD